MTTSAPISLPNLILPLLSFGAGAADAFAFNALGGIFTANMTGNAVLASMFTRPGYAATFAGAGVAMGAFVVALAIGFRATRRANGGRAVRVALLMSGACLGFVALLWWYLPHLGPWLLWMVAGSAAAMALQTVAAKRDRIARGATTTFLTGTLTDVVEDIVDGRAPVLTHRWYPLAALPLGAALATLVGMVAPIWTPLLPLAVTLLCALLAEPLRSSQRRSHSPNLSRI